MPVVILSTKRYFGAYGLLLLLLLVNVLLGLLNLGWGNMFLAVTIAALQAAVLALLMMHGLFESALVKLMMCAGLLWFLILVTLTMTDYITRNWLPVAGK